VTASVIIQARMGSSRLYGKIMMDICGKTMLERVVNSAARAKNVSDVIIATSELLDDDIVADCSKEMNCKVYRGSEEDVLDRYYRAARMFGATDIVRITADCPLMDSDIIDKVVQKYEAICVKGKYVANTLYRRTYPRGMDVEVFDSDMLFEAWKYAKDKSFREHVTPYMINYKDQNRVYPVYSDKNHSKYRLTVDTDEDIRLIREIYRRSESDHISCDRVVTMLTENPDLFHINSGIVQAAL
jgi:spore coat polysaccharide biosynthesis protein SpsF